MVISELSLDWALPSVISAAIAFAFGIFWYHPKVLGSRWLMARGKVADDLKPPAKPNVGSLGLWFMAALFYSFLSGPLQVDTISEYFLLSCLLWVGFAMPPVVMGSLYTGYPFDAVAIDASYQLAGYYIFAVVHILFIYI